MSIINTKVKVTENKASRGLESLKFNISYETSSSEDKQRKNSYSIISALKGSNRLLIDVNSSLFNLPESSRENYAIDFIKVIRSFGLEYRYKKSPSSGGQGILSKLFSMAGSKSRDAHQVFVLVTDEAWANQDFISALPFYGAKYYIFKNGVDAEKVLENMNNGQILDFEIYDYFSAIVFDCSSYGQMGVYTESLSLNDIKSKLGL